jgi:hypothetical protein
MTSTSSKESEDPPLESSEIVEWQDGEWTEEILSAMIDVITLWENTHGLFAGDPRNITEFQPRPPYPVRVKQSSKPTKTT